MTAAVAMAPRGYVMERLGDGRVRLLADDRGRADGALRLVAVVDQARALRILGVLDLLAEEFGNAQVQGLDPRERALGVVWQLLRMPRQRVRDQWTLSLAAAEVVRRGLSSLSGLPLVAREELRAEFHERLGLDLDVVMALTARAGTDAAPTFPPGVLRAVADALQVSEDPLAQAAAFDSFVAALEWIEPGDRHRVWYAAFLHATDQAGVDVGLPGREAGYSYEAVWNRMLCLNALEDAILLRQAAVQAFVEVSTSDADAFRDGLDDWVYMLRAADGSGAVQRGTQECLRALLDQCLDVRT